MHCYSKDVCRYCTTKFTVQNTYYTHSHIIDGILQLEQQEYFNCSGTSGDYLGAILHWPNATSGNN